MQWKRALKRAAVGIGLGVPTVTAGACIVYRIQHRPKLPTDDLPKQHGRVIVITGATSGVGRAAAQQLGGLGAKVVIGARDASRGEAARQDVVAAGGTAEVFPLDLSSLQSVQSFCLEVSRRHASIDVLLCAAAEIVAEPVLSEDGMDKAFVTNLLSVQSMITAMEPALRRSQEPRVVLVGSRLERKGSRLCIESLQTTSGASLLQDGKYRDAMEHYAITKRALMLLALELRNRWHKKGSRIELFVVTPGMVHTNLWANFPLWYRTLTYPVRALALRSAEDGARGVVYAAACPELSGEGGLYLADGVAIEPSDGAQNQQEASHLYQVCEELIQRCSK